MLFDYASRTRMLRPSAIREILKVTSSPDIISFAGGLPAAEFFPVKEIAEIAAEVLAKDGQAALQYGVTEGYAPLREILSRRIGDSLRMQLSPDDILVLNGSQQGLDLIAKVLLNPGDLVLVENPSYLGALQVFSGYEADVIGVHCDDDGIDPEALRRALQTAPKRPKFLYAMPNFQNPTGRAFTLERREAVAKIALEFGLPIIEDDPYGELRYSGAALPSLLSLIGVEHGVYLGSASKILAPGLRVAWMVCRDQTLRERLTAAKQAADLQTNSYCQRIVAQFLSRHDAMTRHLDRLRFEYKTRRDAMLGLLEKELPADCVWTKPEGGMFVWVTMPRGVDTVKLFPLCAAEKVAFVPGEYFWPAADVRNTLRLNFSHASVDRITTGIGRFGQVLRRSMA